MGVDLRLQRLYLRILLRNLLLVDLADQGIGGLCHHVVKGICQFPNLILPPVWHTHREILPAPGSWPRKGV